MTCASITNIMLIDVRVVNSKTPELSMGTWAILASGRHIKCIPLELNISAFMIITKIIVSFRGTIYFLNKN